MIDVNTSQCFNALVGQGNSNITSGSSSEKQLPSMQVFEGGTGNNSSTSNYFNNGTGHNFCHPTPSPSDSGVMSPMTPMSNYTTGSTPDQNLLGSPEHSNNSVPYFSHQQPSPADSGFHCNSGVSNGTPSPYPTLSSVEDQFYQNNLNLEQQCLAGANNQMWNNIQPISDVSDEFVN